MPNPLYQQLQQSNQFANGGNMVERFNRFRQTFHGDPREQIQRMLNSGQISQAQYNHAVQMAKQMMQFMK